MLRRNVSRTMPALLLIGMLTLAFISKPVKTNLNTREAEESFSADDIQFTHNETKHNRIENEEQVRIVEHRITALELQKLKWKIGVWREGRNHNRIINGYGTGLRPPTEEEWAEIAVKNYIVERVLLSQTPPLNIDHTIGLWFPPIGNQDGEGSCVAWAVGYYVKTFQEAKDLGWNLSEAKWIGGYHGYPTPAYQNQIVSPDFIYHLINGGIDQGSTFYDAINLVCVIGASSWKEMPYDPNDSTSWPSEEAWREAPLYRGNSSGYEYLELDTGDDLISLKNWIASNHLAIIAVDANQYSDLTSEDFWTLGNYGNLSINHANTIVGYNDAVEYIEGGELCRGAFKIANSWGEGGWENVPDGCYWISYEAMKQRVGYCMFYRDRIGYRPELATSFRINHSKRGECDILIGIGNHSDPLVTKGFNDFIDGGDYPFCSNNIMFDITELKDIVPTVYNQSFFIRVYDGDSITTGTITDFSIIYAVSEYPPITTANGNYVYADVILPDTIRVPLHYTTIQKAINAVVLGLDENPRVTIQAAPGTYNENIVINKTISLIGENSAATIIDANKTGIVLNVAANEVTFSGFTVRNSGHGFQNSSIFLFHTDNCSISGNIINSSYTGILLLNSSYNQLSDNIITNCAYGIFLDNNSSCNTISHNNFINNTCQAQVDESYNIWDNGYPSGGNYWSNYNGTDSYSGPHQNETGSDGKGDTPYVINANNTDRYPFMKPYPGPVHDIGITSVTPSKTVIGQGLNSSMHVNVTIFNYGNNTENFNVTAYANTLIIDTVIDIALTSRNSTIITFTWNTTGFSKGSYTISAYATPVLDETDTMDNNLTDGWVTVAMVGDLTGGSANVWDFVPDGKVDGKDMIIVARCFGSWPEAPPPLIWHPNCDINNDNKVDGRDLIVVARHYGETDP